MATDERKEFLAHLVELFNQVDEETQERHVDGAQKYGALKFLTVDTLEEALQELYDLVNYARYTAIKVKLLQEFIAEKAAALVDDDTTGGQTGFISTGKFWEKGFTKE